MTLWTSPSSSGPTTSKETRLLLFLLGLAVSLLAFQGLTQRRQIDRNTDRIAALEAVVIQDGNGRLLPMEEDHGQD